MCFLFGGLGPSKGSRSVFVGQVFFGRLGYHGQKTAHFPETSVYLALAPQASKTPLGQQTTSGSLRFIIIIVFWGRVGPELVGFGPLPGSNPALGSPGPGRHRHPVGVIRTFYQCSDPGPLLCAAPRLNLPLGPVPDPFGGKFARHGPYLCWTRHRVGAWGQHYPSKAP